MEWLFPYLLFLHVLGAIVAFGPSFAAPVLGTLVAREPQHANFYARGQLLLARRVITPVALSMGVTGVLMLLVAGINLGQLWLDLAIGLYVVALVFSIVVQAPAGARLVQLTASPSPGGPSPELRATARRVRMGGLLLAGLVVVIVFLMVVKPVI